MFTRRRSSAGTLEEERTGDALKMAKAGRTNKRFAESKAAVVAAAIYILNRRGVSRMTLADVAARLGYSTPTIQYYFKKKEDLAAACLQQGLSRISSFLSAAEAGDDARARLKLFLSAYFDFKARSAREENEEIPSFSDARGLNLVPVNDAYSSMYRQLRGLIGSAESAPPKGVALNSAAHLILSELHWTPVWFRRVYPEDCARVGERIFYMLVDGIAAPRADYSLTSISVVLPELESSEVANFDMFLRAATAQINEQGFRGTSVDSITARINLTKGAFYHHIKTKDEVVLACFKRTFDIMRLTIIAAEAAGGTGLQTLATLATTLVEHQITGDAPLLRVSAVDTMNESNQAAIMAGIDQVVTRIASVISDGIADGSIRSIDANIGAHMILGLINSADELHHFVRGISPSEATEHYVRPLFRGLLPAGKEQNAQLQQMANDV